MQSRNLPKQFFETLNFSPTLKDYKWRPFKFFETSKKSQIVFHKSNKVSNFYAISYGTRFIQNPTTNKLSNCIP